ncbi:MAG TPA: bifunctional phosphoribosylaminoimidazolecarboxamide formyltransferase/IMP cyclohydrolase [Microbacteriaceae bacterium]|nr:bifunctional phosphoribosylaminoimidazolecarboxamide formyltransferase/IMP cyclohydrolase [Microbacteriaceae bacterium]
MNVKSQPANLYEHRDRVKVKRALVSVSDKTGLEDFAKKLVANGIEIVSTGSTANIIKNAGLNVTEVSEVTGFEEALDGRVKTLHPAVHAGLLADLRLDNHRTQLKDLKITPFELVVVNLYPFDETVAAAKPQADIIENVDIGGPAMVRAAAKNHANVAIVVDPANYDSVIDVIETGGTTLALRRELATAAFVHTARYDTSVANWFLEQEEKSWEETSSDSISSSSMSEDAVSASQEEIDAIFDDSENMIGYELFGVREATLRYGENSHQRAALFCEIDNEGIAQAKQLQGKEMSYNNYVDADAAVRAAYDHERPAVAIIKHANPCGIAEAPEGAADPISVAHKLAHECDPVSAFGGVVAANRRVSAQMAENIVEIFTEVLVAPGFEDEALKILSAKKNLRLLELPETFKTADVEVKQISGGFLVQDSDKNFAASADWELVAGEPASPKVMAELEFAWRACRAVKSNGILLTSGGASVGVGMGQVNRVDSCHLAVSRAGERAAGSVAASDAFFPFADGLEVLLEAGVKAVVQPGGSIRDKEVIAAAQQAGVTMYFTGERHFFH